jgi:hypothetical protein
MKRRRHSNNTGLTGIKSGNNERKLKNIARKLKIPFGDKPKNFMTSQAGPSIANTSLDVT